jgi:hypothetical protein
MEISKIAEAYSQNYINTEELSYIRYIEKYLRWKLFNDVDKQIYRKAYIQMIDIHFSHQKSLKYEEKLINFTDKIVECLQKFPDYTYSDQIKNNIESIENYFFRIRSLLICEKEFLFMKESIKSIKFHIPYETFEPLIEKVKDTKEYKEYKLDELFIEYKKMLELFAQNPYE